MKIEMMLLKNEAWTHFCQSNRMRILKLIPNTKLNLYIHMSKKLREISYSQVTNRKGKEVRKVKNPWRQPNYRHLL